MLGIKVAIIRYASDEPQPGIVECELEDAHGRRWSFIEKTAIVSTKDLDARSIYPKSGFVVDEVVGRSLDAAGREVIRFSTRRPWSVESVEGVTEFDIRPDSLVEW